MGTFSFWHWFIVLAVVLIIFGAGKLPNVMGDLAKGIKNFKSGMQEGEDEQKPVLTRDETKPAATSSTYNKEENRAA
ncbi:sec-independent protein translocase protein TatA [Arboricoccus pini]|uniref:Sec-independent protein translocase protein TatA n=1 Tax=Arboricoccus pini TaxID=1963835 RepID=A0A212PYU6_9PROT|nr:twin-arginine translocase TatA/TatE family subunit [Arboricoccus pini]SNB52159.1 sec-independent protein translocase protein TatA [Arboricoccus pini]